MDELLNKARRTILQFRERFGVTWEAFHRLERLDVKWHGLDAKHWKRVVKGDASPYTEKRQLTIEFAELIETSPATVLQGLTHRNSVESAPLLYRLAFPANPNTYASEVRAKEMIAQAGNGMPRSALDCLVEECQLKIKHHPEEVMPLVRAIVYISSRYHKLNRFIDIVSDFLPKMQRTKVRAVEPVLRAQVIAQIVSFLLDHGNVDAAERYIHRPDVKSLLSASCSPNPWRSQMLRNFALFKAIKEKKVEWAIDCITDSTDRNDPASRRSAAIASSTAWRLKREFGKAYNVLAEEHQISLDILTRAADKNRLDIGHLAQHVSCVLRGTVCRFIYEVDRGKQVDLNQEIGALRFALEHMRFVPLDNQEFQPLHDNIQLPSALEEIRRSCLTKKLKEEDINIIDELVQALS